MRRSTAAALVFVVFVALAFMIMPSHASMSKIQGTVYWYDQYRNLHPLAWAQVVAEGDGGEPAMVVSATDGTYMMWVAPGTYNVTASSEPGYIPESHMVTVSDGGSAAVDFQLEPSGEPIPEYPVAIQPVMLAVAALAAAIMIRRRHRAHP
jgi:hypothetical protein